MTNAKNIFESFLSKAAFNYCTDEEFQRNCVLAGIRWATLPRLFPVEIVLEYMQEKAISDHKLALFKVKKSLETLDRNNVQGYTGLPYDVETLAGAFSECYKNYQYFLLGQKLLVDPQNGEAIINAWRIESGSKVVAADTSAFLEIKLLEYFGKIKKGEARVRIPGFPLLSDAIGGFNPERLMLVLAETGYGKTNLGINLALSAAERIKVGYINMEMSFEDIALRVAVIGSGKPYTEMYAKQNESWEIKEITKRIPERLYFTNGRILSIEDIKAWIKLNKPKIVFIDYDQKLDLPFDRNTPEWRQLQRAVLELEDFSKEEKFCCVLMAQVNREGEISASHRATFAAHTILHFFEDSAYGAIIHAKKNRHGKKNAAITVLYSQENSSIKETSVITYDKKSKKEGEYLK